METAIVQPVRSYLRAVSTHREGSPAAVPAWGDLALVATLLAVNLVPIVGQAVRRGSWGGGTVGFATGCALLTGRELWLELRAIARTREQRAATPSPSALRGTPREPRRDRPRA